MPKKKEKGNKKGNQQEEEKVNVEQTGKPGPDEESKNVDSRITTPSLKGNLDSDIKEVIPREPIDLSGTTTVLEFHKEEDIIHTTPEKISIQGPIKTEKDEPQVKFEESVTENKQEIPETGTPKAEKAKNHDGVSFSASKMSIANNVDEEDKISASQISVEPEHSQSQTKHTANADIKEITEELEPTSPAPPTENRNDYQLETSPIKETEQKFLNVLEEFQNNLRILEEKHQGGSSDVATADLIKVMHDMAEHNKSNEGFDELYLAYSKLLIRVLIQQGQNDQAVQVGDKIIQDIKGTKASLTTIHILLGEALKNLGQFSDAQKMWKNAESELIEQKSEVELQQVRKNLEEIKTLIQVQPSKNLAAEVQATSPPTQPIQEIKEIEEVKEAAKQIVAETSRLNTENNEETKKKAMMLSSTALLLIVLVREVFKSGVPIRKRVSSGVALSKGTFDLLTSDQGFFRGLYTLGAVIAALVLNYRP